ncbi:hypothetical protein B4140_1439 [Bacillus amyloliquefaciens]|nr:hypothetical protein B4140_1439 [Bacillus amyloliquefaciens]
MLVWRRLHHLRSPEKEAAADREFSSYGSGKFSQSLHGNA